MSQRQQTLFWVWNFDLHFPLSLRILLRTSFSIYSFDFWTWPDKVPLLRRSLVLYTIWSSPQLSVPTRCCADQVNSEPHTGIEDIGHSDDQVNIESFTPMQLYFSDFLFLDLVLPSFLSPPDAALTKLAARTSDTLMTKLTSSFTPMQLYFCSLKYDSCAPSCLCLVLIYPTTRLQPETLHFIS